MRVTKKKPQKQQGDTGGTQQDWSIYQMPRIQLNLSKTLFTRVTTKKPLSCCVIPGLKPTQPELR